MWTNPRTQNSQAVRSLGGFVVIRWCSERSIAGSIMVAIWRVLVLQREDVVEVAVVALGPDVVAGIGVDELRRDAHPMAGLAHAALDDVARAQLLANLSNVG